MSEDRGNWKVRLLIGTWTIATIVVMTGLVVFSPDAMLTLRHAAYDTYQKIKPREYVAAPVRIVDIDEASLDKNGQWPWPRTRMAELVRRLGEAGAAVIAFDVIMAEPDRSSPAQAVANWQLPPDLVTRLAKLPDHDAVLADELKRWPVVLGFALRDFGEDFPRVKARFINVGGEPIQFLQRQRAATLPIRILEEAAAGNGAVAFTPDADGIVRKIHLVYNIGGKLAPSLTVEALRVAQAQTNIFIKMAASEGEQPSTGVEEIKIGAAVVPTGANGEVWLHYTPTNKARFIPAWQVLDGSAPKDKLAGHLVLIGTSAAGLKDLRYTSQGEQVPGVEIHAQFLEQVTTGSYLVRPGWALAAEPISIAVVGILVAVAVTMLGAVGASVVSVALFAITIVSSWYAFSSHTLLLDPVPAIATLLIVFIGCSIARYVASELRQRFIRNAFSSYVSPNLVDHIVASPEGLSLGGERRVCSFVFTDLEGFTSLMEAIDPAQAVGLLNDYLDEMVSIAFRHDGTLDRIVGDAVAVMFSAPIVQEDHADRAVRCALEMDRFAEEFAGRQRRDGIAFGRTRIGVHSGEVIVGNFGGRTIFDYRALGDPINTASRLEGANKYIGTRLCVSGATVAACQEFTGRPIGELLLKGKTEPVMAFEPSRDGKPDNAYLVAYERLEQGADSAEASFHELAVARPKDSLVQLHLERIRGGDEGTLIVLEEK
jgi:adenylate cyclase